jgi:hypothetical protein
MAEPLIGALDGADFALVAHNPEDEVEEVPVQRDDVRGPIYNVPSPLSRPDWHRYPPSAATVINKTDYDALVVLYHQPTWLQRVTGVGASAGGAGAQAGFNITVAELKRQPLVLSVKARSQYPPRPTTAEPQTPLRVKSGRYKLAFFRYKGRELRLHVSGKDWTLPKGAAMQIHVDSSDFATPGFATTFSPL